MKKLNRKNAEEACMYPSRILQFGEGNFLRAFADWIVFNMNKNGNFNTGIDIVQPLPKGMIDVLNKQDGLYHVYLKGIDNGKPVTQLTLIDCINKGVNPYSQFELYKKLVLNPDLRFVISNTTEAGIAWEEGDSLEMMPQKSFPGKIAALLYMRYKEFNGDNSKGLIFFACELIEKNGEMLKKYVIQYAEKWNLGSNFIKWIEQACCFCSTLVDRIVPGFPRDEIDDIQHKLGYEDNLVVVGEYFHLWVIEAPDWVQNEFPAKKAGLEVKFVKSLKNYRERKVRILNGCHTGSFAVAYLSNIETVRQAYQSKITGAFMSELIFDEVLPILKGDKDDLKLFAEKILERFDNPFIKHQWKSIALNAMSKWETRNLPSVIDFYEKYRRLPKKMVFSLAALIAYYKGEVNGLKYEIEDEQWIVDFYNRQWNECDGTPKQIYKLCYNVLELEKVWNRNLNNIPDLTNAVSHYLFLITQVGMEKATLAVINR